MSAAADPMLRVDVVTLFPELLGGAFEHSIVARGVASGRVAVAIHDLRDHAEGPHAQADDAPFGGGPGMILKPEPVFRAVEAITGRPAGEHVPDEAVVLLTPAAPRFAQAHARRFARLSRLVLLCGRYEGVDERVRSIVASESLSIGDFVLSGGEPAAACIVDAVVRLVPGVLGNAESTTTESHEEDGLLEAPQWTRPASYRGHDVPPVLLSGHHGEIARWRRAEAVRTTARCRPDLLAAAVRAGALSKDEREALARDGLEASRAATAEPADATLVMAGKAEGSDGTAEGHGRDA